MKAIKLIIVVGLILIGIVNTSAQPNTNEKIQAFKVAYLTKHLDLTPQEAQQFWPLYNEMEKKINVLKNSHKKKIQEMTPRLSKFSDKEIEELVDSEIVFKQKELDIKKAYHSKYKTVLPIRKVAKLYRSEEQFKRELLKRIRESKEKK